MPMKQHYLWSEPELVNHLRSLYATDMFSHFLTITIWFVSYNSTLTY